MLRIVSAALMMTLLDFLIEPVAIAYDFWSWEAVSIPIQNYGAWFLISAVLHFVFNKLMPESNNPLAIKILYIQAIFFLILNFIPIG